MNPSKLIQAAVIGHAVGDALGVPVEFVSREDLRTNPVTDMLGYGSHQVPKGTWSDDTSMALCTLHSLTKHGIVDLDAIMEEFSQWVEEGYMTPYGRVFDIGRTCLHAIMNYRRGNDGKHCGCAREFDNGNGSLMRILPVSLYNYFTKADRKEAIERIHAVSALTHAHERSCIACGIYDFVVQELMEAPEIASVTTALLKARRFYGGSEEMKSFQRLCAPEFALTAEEDIKSSGYVVDTLEAAIWCLLTTEDYSECVLKAVNLGRDTDTVAAVAGGLAGILYGYERIPCAWIEALAEKDMILQLCTEFSLRLSR